MKVICPHCGLKGTADKILQDKKVRCPQCQKIFRLSETNAFSVITTSQEINVADPLENVKQDQPDQPLHIEIPVSQVVPQPGKIPAMELGVCSICGFSLSQAYLEKKDEKLYCRICLPA